VKVSIKAMKGVRRESLPSYLDEFMWRERYGQVRDDAFQKLWEFVASKHPLP